jgi:hypothetical protein
LESNVAEGGWCFRLNGVATGYEVRTLKPVGECR